MPKQRRLRGTINQVEDTDISSEEYKVLKNRRYRFKELLGENAEDHQIEILVNSKVDYWDLDDLLKKGCDPELAMDILL